MTDGLLITPYQHYFSDEHHMMRQTVRRFVDTEIKPYVDEWEETETIPRSLYQKAGELGILGVTYPEAYGGLSGDIFMKLVVSEELVRSTSGGVAASLGSHDISIPPIIKFGTEEQKQRWVTPVLSGERISALAVTEPSGGSDVANLQTTAIRDGDYYIINGSKTFITNGGVADQITCAVRTGGDGVQGISMLVMDTQSEGFGVSKKLKKMGWWASDTSQLFFDNVHVPVENLIGEENMGFYIIMSNFQMERLSLAVMATTTAEIALELAMDYVQQREAFGRPIVGFQVTRHKLADMATQIEVSKEFNYRIAAKIGAGEDCTTEISMAKNFACQVADFVTYQAVQLFGGYGYMREYPVERLYRDNRILSIGGGTQEIMKEIISKRMFNR